MPAPNSENSWSIRLTRGPYTLQKLIPGNPSIHDLEDAMDQLLFRMDTVDRALHRHFSPGRLPSMGSLPQA